MLTTKQSLIFRVRDADDLEAWTAFVDIYGPLVCQYGRRRGLQDADAADLAQDVLREVACSIKRFDYDSELGRFRNWLLVIARYKLSHLVRKKGKARGTGDTANLRVLEQQTAPDELADQWESEYRSHMFRWAAELVRAEVNEQSWEAFWATAVEGRTPTTVAAALGMKVGAVYVAKSRVLLRIREKIASVDDSIGG
ncbi:MAG: sigma-70 family RNA polymerase sigma factor [Lacipirellulaceae bacterium]